MIKPTLDRWLNAKVIATLPIFISVNIAALSVWLLDISSQSMPLVLGIIAGGLVDLDNRLTGRVKNVFYTLIAFSISSLAVQVSLGNAYQFTLLMTGMTFIFTLIGAIGQRYSTIAFGTLVIALYTTLSYLPETPWFINPLMILGGTLLYSIVTLIVYLFFPNRPVQENIANSFLKLADYLEAKSQFFDPDDIEQLAEKEIHLAMQDSKVIEAFNACRTALFYRIRGQYRHRRTSKMIRYYFAAQEIHERVHSNLFRYQTLIAELKNSDLIFRIQRLFELQAQACREVSYSLKQNKTYHYNPKVKKAIAGLMQSFELYKNTQIQHKQTHLHLTALIENIIAIDWQLHHLDQEANQIENSNTAKIHSEQINGLRGIFYAIKSQLNFNSQLFRHAVRLSIIVFVCCSIVEFFQLDRGYWILLTAVFVCQPNYSATKTRLKQRVLGTILGVIIGSLLPYLNPTLPVQLGLIVATSTLFFFFRSNNYSFSTFFITIQVLISFNIMGFDLHFAMYSRVLDTLIGAAIAWIGVAYLWPDWKYLQLDKVSRNAIKSNSKYLLYILCQLQFGKGDPLKYRLVRRQAHENATALSATVSNMNSEPKKYQAYLSQGFELLKINYSLLSYISALGAYRHNMKQLQQDTAFLSAFYPIAKKIIYLLEHIDQLESSVFDKLMSKIELDLKQASQLDRGDDLTVPMQQLNMISQTLPTLYKLFH